MVKNAFDQKTFSVHPRLLNGGPGNHKEHLLLVIFENDFGDFFEVSSFLEEQVNAQLFFALSSALVVLPHSLPVEVDVEFGEEKVDQIAQKKHKIEVFRAKRAPTVLLKESVSHIKLVAVFAVKIQKSQHESKSSEQPSDIG